MVDTFIQRINFKILFVLVFLIALILRLWGINYDLPYIYHPDEPVALAIIHRMFRTRDLNPHFFHWPSLLFYLNLLAYIPYYLLGKLLGNFQTPADLVAPTELAMGVTRAQLPSLVLLGRLITLSFSLGTIGVTFLIARQLTQKIWLGLIAALLLAISPTSVEQSRFITPDTLAAFFILAAFLASALVLQKGETRHYILAGICIGLAVSCKYNGGLIVIPLLLAHFWRYGWKGFKVFNLYLALFLSVLLFLITTPFAVLDSPKFLVDLEFDSQHYATGHPGMEGDTLKWYLNYLWQTTGFICLLALFEILRGFYSRSREIILLAIFPVTYFVFISRFLVRNERTIFPITPFLFLLAASLFIYLFNQVKTIKPGRYRNLTLAALGLVAVISLAWPTVKSVKSNLYLTALTSRETARIWIAANLPPGAKVAVESYAPFVAPEQFSVQGFVRMIDNPPEWYLANNFEYLIFGQGMFGRFYRDPDRYQTEISHYNRFFEQFKLLKTFNDGEYEVRVYQVKPD